MKTYYVEIQFKDGTCYSIQDVPAASIAGAKELALKDAKMSGMLYAPVKKVIAKLK